MNITYPSHGDREASQVLVSRSGIRVVCHYSSGPVSHCGMMIGAGTRDEPPGKQGLAHFLEHMLFKGTTQRTSYQVISRLEAVGGELNAFTTKEETCVHASFLTPHFDRTMELLSDILLNSIFPEKEMNLEKQVVMDEIRSYADNPMEQIFDDFECQVFQGQALGTPVLGTRESVSAFRRSDLARFIRTCFTAGRMVFSYAGSLPSVRVMAAIDKFFPAGHSTREKNTYTRSGRTQVKQAVHRKPIQQAHYMTGARAYSCHSSKRFTLFLMNNILGGPGLNSRLNVNLRERNGLTYHIESSYVPFRDTGLFQVYLATDSSKVERAAGLVMKEFRKLRGNAISGSQLTRHKYQLKGQLALAQENISGIMLANAKSVLNYNRPVRLNEVFRKIDNITANDLLEVANELLDERRLSSLLFQPEE